MIVVIVVILTVIFAIYMYICIFVFPCHKPH